MSAKPHPCALPSASELPQHLARLDYCDSACIDAASGDMTITEIYAALLDRPPGLLRHLLVLRSVMVRPFGIRGVTYAHLAERIDTSRHFTPGDRIGRWTLFAQSRDELVTGSDDRHLDFRVSVLRDRTKKSDRIVLSTGVQTHNAFGRAYLRTILPFHRWGIAQLLARGVLPGQGNRSTLARP